MRNAICACMLYRHLGASLSACRALRKRLGVPWVTVRWWHTAVGRRASCLPLVRSSGSQAVLLQCCASGVAQPGAATHARALDGGSQRQLRAQGHNKGNNKEIWGMGALGPRRRTQAHPGPGSDGERDCRLHACIALRPAYWGLLRASAGGACFDLPLPLVDLCPSDRPSNTASCRKFPAAHSDTVMTWIAMRTHRQMC